VPHERIGSKTLMGYRPPSPLERRHQWFERANSRERRLSAAALVVAAPQFHCGTSRPPAVSSGGRWGPRGWRRSAGTAGG